MLLGKAECEGKAPPPLVQVAGPEAWAGPAAWPPQSDWRGPDKPPTRSPTYHPAVTGLNSPPVKKQGSLTIIKTTPEGFPGGASG